MAERQFGPYRLVRQIAVGGMAEIHLAKTRGIAGFEKFVALKMIHPNFAQDEQFIQMLIDEAKIAVQLQHVNIAQTFDLGRVGETYYITMEFVDGADLYKILRRGSEQDLDVPLDVCAYVAKEAATGLDYAHRKRDVHGNPLGIVHRDVSPQNVLISHAGEVKLVDFGIAKATMRARQTQVGVIKGKYYYMSPEQAWADPLDHRSDVFSCGILLYEMITGQMLYLEEDLHRLLDLVRRADIAPPTTLRADVPPQLERIVMNALAKRPEDRYQSAADFATDLERFLHTYSPVFTASKLAGHLRKVVGEPVALLEPQGVSAPRSPHQATQPIDRRELVQERSEITDENSVIFRMDELRARDHATPRGKRAPTAPPRARSQDESTAAALPRGAHRKPTGADAIPTAPRGRRPTTVPPPIPPAVPRPPTPAQGMSRPRQPTPTQGLPWPRPPTPAQGMSRPRPPTQPPPLPASPARAPLPAPMIPASTMTLDASDLADVEEMTAISGPPKFAAAGASPLDYSDFEATVIERGAGEEPTDSEDGPTITRDGLGVPLPPPVQLSSSETMPSGHAERRARLRPGTPAHPALAASTPTPAISELRRPRGSRRTPPGGVPHGNVLRELVRAAAQEPMPTVPIRSRDAVPRAMPDTTTSGATTTPQPLVTQAPPWPVQVGGPPPGGPPSVANAVPQPLPTGPIPGQHQLPVAFGPPGLASAPVPGVPSGAHPQPGWPPQPPFPAQQQGMPLIAPPTPPPGSIPAPQLPPHLVHYGGFPHAAQTVMPGAPPGYQAASFTRQMQAALELDDLPQRYRFQEARQRKLMWAIVLVALFAGGIGLAVLLTRQASEGARAELVIESLPSNATVTVDGIALAEKTPSRFRTEPRARHEIEVSAPRHKPWRQTIVVPSSGGDVKIVAVLSAAKVKLRINSVPGGAEILINDEVRGVTPKVIEDLDPATAKKVALRLKDFAPEERALDWGDRDTIDLEVRFHR